MVGFYKSFGLYFILTCQLLLCCGNLDKDYNDLCMNPPLFPKDGVSLETNSYSIDGHYEKTLCVDPPFPCCPVSWQCPWKKTLIEKKKKKNSTFLFWDLSFFRVFPLYEPWPYFLSVSFKGKHVRTQSTYAQSLPKNYLTFSVVRDKMMKNANIGEGQ